MKGPTEQALNCDAALALLDDHVDGALDAAENRALREHLAACSRCRDEADGLSALLTAAAGLPDSIPPGRDLWAEIVPRLGPRTQPPVLPRRATGPSPGVAWAAVAAILALAVLGGLYLRAPRPADGAAAAGNIADVAPDPRKPHLATGVPAELETPFDEAQLAFDEARRSLLLALDQQRGSLSPETQAMVDRNLGIVDEAIREIRGALARDPANLELNRMLMTYHNRELDLLQRVTRHATRL